MALSVKICGLKTQEAIDAAVDGRASLIGFVFYPASPRAVTIEQAAELAQFTPKNIRKVGLFVDPTDEELQFTLKKVPLEMIQLHGDETPMRVLEIRAMTGKQVMKAIRVASAEDLRDVSAYEDVADWLLFDAKVEGAQGGTGKSFDWKLLAGRQAARPWMLAGGLNFDNLAKAVHITGARMVDVSSGVEDVPGVKNPDKIRELLQLAATL